MEMQEHREFTRRFDTCQGTPNPYLKVRGMRRPGPQSKERGRDSLYFSQY